jgi:hypothetical protein
LDDEIRVGVGLAADHQARPLRILAKDDHERAG